MLLNKDLKVLLVQNLLYFESLIFDTDKVLKLLEHFDKNNFDHETSTVIKNVLNTLDFIQSLDLKEVKIDLSLYKKLNELLAYEQSLAPGVFRKEGHYAYIPCIKDPIPAPSIIEINYQLDCLNSLSLNDYKTQVSRIFCDLCKSQPFYDGNKRSTLCLCNLALLKQNKEMLIIKNDQYDEFDRLLTEFYVGSNKNLVSFLANL